jgi:SOS-response transcriptional repressor LexA
VIIGPEISYDPAHKVIVVDKSKYLDSNGHKGVTDPEELKRYIINIYKTLLTRGILGTYVYIVDENLRQYVKEATSTKTMSVKKEVETIEDIPSPYQQEMIELPLYDSVGCGELMYADPIAHETYPVPASLVKPGGKYFVLRTSGDSMNLLGIDDGDYILCQKNYQASSGSNAVVLIGNDATLKQIKYEQDGLTLIPRSTNSEHKIRTLTEEDEEFKVLGVYICKLN